MKKILIMDLETNGLNSKYDEVVNFGALEIDENFNIIKEYDRFYFLNKQKENIQASNIHNLTQTKIKELRAEQKAKYAEHFINDLEIKQLIKNSDVIIGYNILDFDLQFIKKQMNLRLFTKFYKKEYCDLMHDMTDVCAIDCGWDYYKWPKLEESLAFFNETFESLNLQQHTALADCKATLFLFKKLYTYNKDKNTFELKDEYNNYDDYY